MSGKGKAIPVTGREGPYGCETSRLPHYLDNRLTDCGETVSFTRLYPQESYPYNRPWRPIRLWDVEGPTLYRQSAHRWRWDCQPYAPLPPGKFLVLISVRGWVNPRAIVRLEGLCKLEKINDLIGTRDLPACSIVPQLTTLPRAPSLWGTNWILYILFRRNSVFKGFLTRITKKCNKHKFLKSETSQWDCSCYSRSQDQFLLQE
jgi:hypothetical protein